jgi:adenosine/AMP kinase
MELKLVKIEKPADCNIILGQSHFIKSIEDIHESMIGSCPSVKFGAAFCESSGPCLVRVSGNDEELQKIASRNASNIAAGHSFIIIMKDAYPVNVLNAIKNIPEVCSVYCATANDVEVVIAETEQGRGILGVIDGLKSKGIETPDDVKKRKEFLRKLGYKL